jgi:hypothetical protein
VTLSLNRYRGRCIISGLQCIQKQVDLSKIKLSDISVVQQFTISVAFSGRVHYVLASAHESVAHFRRKLCAILSIECSEHSPLLRGTDLSEPSLRKNVYLEDSKLLIQHGILNNAHLSVFCPLPDPAASSVTPLPTAAHEDVRHDAAPPPARLTVGNPGASDATVVRVCSAHPVDVRILGSLSEIGAGGLSVACLKRLIETKIGVPPAMQIICIQSGPAVAENFSIQSDALGIDCHLMPPSHICARLRLGDGREKMLQVLAGVTRPRALALTFGRLLCSCTKRSSL